MMADLRLTTGDGRFDLTADVQRIGSDLLVAVHGGEVPHIGAVAVAQHRPSLKGDGTVSATASVICYLGHKEDVIAKTIAERLAAVFETRVVVTAGMHWDHIISEDLQPIDDSVKRLIERIIDNVNRSIMPDGSIQARE
jgi:gallate decarboxylase subunit D